MHTGIIYMYGICWVKSLSLNSNNDENRIDLCYTTFLINDQTFLILNIWEVTFVDGFPFNH